MIRCIGFLTVTSHASARQRPPLRCFAAFRHFEGGDDVAEPRHHLLLRLPFCGCRSVPIAAHGLPDRGLVQRAIAEAERD